MHTLNKYFALHYAILTNCDEVVPVIKDGLVSRIVFGDYNENPVSEVIDLLADAECKASFNKYKTKSR